jgi:hypothetical protein
MSNDEIEARTTTTEHGMFSSKEDAIAEAKLVRQRECAFEDWADDHYGNEGPPYHSCYGENYDDDETVSISIVDVSAELAKVEAALKRAKASKPKSCGGGSGGSGSGGSSVPAGTVGVFGEVKKAKRPPVDVNRFVRNPAHVAGGNVVPASAYPGKGQNSLAYQIQCISDHNYAMRAFCLEGHPHAHYVTYKPKRALRRGLTWLAPAGSTLDAHGKDPNILDMCHLEFTNHKDGSCLLTGANLLAAVDENTECSKASATPPPPLQFPPTYHWYSHAALTTRRVQPHPAALPTTTRPAALCFLPATRAEPNNALSHHARRTCFI